MVGPTRSRVAESRRAISNIRTSSGFHLHEPPVFAPDLRSCKNPGGRDKKMMRVTPLIVAMVVLTFVSPANADDSAELEIGGCKIQIIFSSAPAEPVRNLVSAWGTSSARAVTTYYGQFPVSQLRIRLRFFDGRGVRGGRTTGWNGPMISIGVGQSSSASDFTEDWILTHEMVHLGFPSVPEQHHWIEEGSATYIEPIARARAGDLSPKKVWGDLVDGLPKGLPEADDRG